MTGNVLVVSDRPKIIKYDLAALEHSSEVGEIDVSKTIPEAEQLLRTNKYGCAVIDPFLEEFYLRENASPFVGFVGRLNQKGIPVVIDTTYLEDELTRFGFKLGETYACFLDSGSEAKELCDTVNRLLQRGNLGIGHIVVARMVGRVDNPVYKIRAVLETGPKRGEEYFVGYRGNPSSLDSLMVVRMDYPLRDVMDSLGDNIPLAGHFVTSAVPDGFEFAESDQAILYGFWREEQKKRISQVPQSTRSISTFYYPGLMLIALHCGINADQPIPYEVTMTLGVEKSVDRNGTTRAPVKALYHYINYVGKKDPALPRIVTIDENIDFDRMIKPALDETGLVLIQMEPQR